MSDASKADIIMRRLRGETLASIAQLHGVTRQAVAQTCKKAGIAKIAMEVKRANRKPAHDKTARRHGITKEEHKRLVAAGVTRKWAYLVRNCRNRAIPCSLTLKEFAAIVGDLPTGKSKGCYVLSIKDRAAGYVVGNVVVRSASANARATRARDSETPRTAVSTGVYVNYPGREKPFEARAGHKSLGCFATADEAARARAEFLGA